MAYYWHMRQKRQRKVEALRDVARWEPSEGSRFLQGWLRPDRIDLVGNELVWVQHQQDRTSDDVRSWRVSMILDPARMPHLLHDFINLADADPDEIFKYAKRYGVLGICEHGIPAAHNTSPLYPPIPASLSENPSIIFKPS